MGPGYNSPCIFQNQTGKPRSKTPTSKSDRNFVPCPESSSASQTRAGSWCVKETATKGHGFHHQCAHLTSGFLLQKIWNVRCLGATGAKWLNNGLDIKRNFEQMLDPFPLCWDACCLDFTKSIPESGGVIVPSGPTTPPPGVWIEENPGTTARLFSEDYISHFRGSHAGSLPKFSKCPSACFSLSVLNSNKLTLHLQTVAIVVLSDIFRRLLWWVWLYQGGRKKSKLGPGVFLSAVRVLEEVRMRKSTPWSFGCRRWTWTWTQCSRRPNQPEAGQCMLQFFTYMCLVQNFRRMTQSNQVRISCAFYKWAVLCPKHHLLTMSFPPALNRLFSGTFPHSWLPIQYPLPGRREHPW